MGDFGTLWDNDEFPSEVCQVDKEAWNKSTEKIGKKDDLKRYLLKGRIRRHNVLHIRGAQLRAQVCAPMVR